MNNRFMGRGDGEVFICFVIILYNMTNGTTC